MVIADLHRLMQSNLVASGEVVLRKYLPVTQFHFTGKKDLHKSQTITTLAVTSHLIRRCIKSVKVLERRRFQEGILTHCYQRTADNGVLFYSCSDHLVHYTIYCILARRHKIKVLALCQMPDHIHDSIIAYRLEDLGAFKRDVNRTYSRCYNEYYATKGQLFETPYGSALKKEDKAIRTNILYVGNNPVERHLVTNAEEYRWNFLAYAQSAHPFSEQIVIRRSRWALRRAVRIIKSLYVSGKPVNFPILESLFVTLNEQEREQLTDFIISTYNVIDFDKASKFFNGYDNMLQAMHANTGSEYDLKEVFVGRSDMYYGVMALILQRSGKVKEIHEALSFPERKKLALFRLLRRECAASDVQIRKFLHLQAVQP